VIPRSLYFCLLSASYFRLFAYFGSFRFLSFSSVSLRISMFHLNANLSEKNYFFFASKRKKFSFRFASRTKINGAPNSLVSGSFGAVTVNGRPFAIDFGPSLGTLNIKITRNFPAKTFSKQVQVTCS